MESNSYIKQLEEQVAALEEQAESHNKEYDAIKNIIGISGEMILMVAVELSQLLDEDYEFRFRNLTEKEKKKLAFRLLSSVSSGINSDHLNRSIDHLKAVVTQNINNPKEATHHNLIKFNKCIVPKLKEIVDGYTK